MYAKPSPMICSAVFAAAFAAFTATVHAGNMRAVACASKEA